MMKKVFIISFTFLLLSISSFASVKPLIFKEGNVTKSIFVLTDIGENRMVETNRQEPFCHVCCTISVVDPFGGLIGITACAGWFLTSCETAGERACERAMSNALDVFLDSN